MIGQDLMQSVAQAIQAAHMGPGALALPLERVKRLVARLVALESPHHMELRQIGCRMGAALLSLHSAIAARAQGLVAVRLQYLNAQAMVVDTIERDMHTVYRLAPEYEQELGANVLRFGRVPAQPGGLH